MSIKDFYIGQTAELSKIFSDEEVKCFANMSGDLNPIHLDDEYAKKSIFKKRILHGFQTGALISAVIGMKLPGPGAIYLHQEMNFKKPAYIGETVRAFVTITSIKEEKSIIFLETKCLNANGDVLIDGDAIVKLI